MILVLVSAFVFTLVSESTHSLLSFLCLLPLLRAAQGMRPAHAMGVGALWGSSACLFAALDGGSAITASAVGVVGLLVAPALYACGGSWVTRRVGFSPFVLALGWILIECTLGQSTRGALIGSSDSGMLAVVGRHLGSAWSAFVVVYLGSWCLLLVSKWRAALARGYRGAGLTLNLDAFRAPASVAQPIAVPALSHPRAPPRRRAH